MEGVMDIVKSLSWLRVEGRARAKRFPDGHTYNYEYPLEPFNRFPEAGMEHKVASIKKVERVKKEGTPWELICNGYTAEFSRGKVPQPQEVEVTDFHNKRPHGTDWFT